MVRLAVPLTGRASPLRPGPAFPGNWRRQFLVKPYWASSPNSRSGGGGGGSRQASPLSLSSEPRSSRCELCCWVVRADKQTNKLLLWVIEWGGDVSAASTLLLVYYSLPAQMQLSTWHKTGVFHQQHSLLLLLFLLLILPHHLILPFLHFQAFAIWKQLIDILENWEKKVVKFLAEVSPKKSIGSAISFFFLLHQQNNFSSTLVPH